MLRLGRYQCVNREGTLYGGYPVEADGIRAMLETDSPYEVWCVFTEICEHAAAAMLKDGEIEKFTCPNDCKYYRATHMGDGDRSEVVIFPADESPCYVLPASALRGAKRLAGGIEIEEKLPEFSKEEKPNEQ